MTKSQLDRLDYNNKVKERNFNKHAEEGYSESNIITMLIERCPEFTDRRAGKRLLRSLRDEVTIKEFYNGIFDIVKKHMKSNEMDIHHPNFFNVIVEVHRHFKRCLTLDGDTRAKYADKILGIYGEYSLDEVNGENGVN